MGYLFIRASLLPTLIMDYPRYAENLWMGLMLGVRVGSSYTHKNQVGPRDPFLIPISAPVLSVSVPVLGGISTTELVRTLQSLQTFAHGCIPVEVSHIGFYQVFIEANCWCKYLFEVCKQFRKWAYRFVRFSVKPNFFSTHFEFTFWFLFLCFWFAWYVSTSTQMQ